MNDAREAVVQAGRELTAAGLSPGASGNISARDGSVVYISPTGVPLAELGADDLSVIDLGVPAHRAHVDGPPPSKEFPLHIALYRRDPTTTAVIHLHSTHAAAYSCLPPWSEQSAIPPITPYFVMRVGQTPLIPYAAPGSADQAQALEHHALPFRAALLANHGPIVAGATMGHAQDSAVELEEVTRLLLLLQGTQPRLLEPTEVAALAARYGSPWST